VCRLLGGRLPPSHYDQLPPPTLADCLPHDPLFHMLPAGLPTSTHACPPNAAAALAAAAVRAAALTGASGVGVVAESSLAAVALPPGPHGGATCRKRSAAVATPAAVAAKLAPGERRHGRAALQEEEGAVLAPPATAAPAPHTATPRQALGGGGGGRTCKRQRLLLLSAPTGPTCSRAPAPRGRATPHGKAGGDSCGLPQRHAGLRVVARDLSFTPAPPTRQPIAAGKPLRLAAALQTRFSAAAPPCRCKQLPT
jgi:hypothetical protein